tara:strand:- start:126 stop:359 length:234 start_codon:yes stop_codon:yes gene_type:complete
MKHWKTKEEMGEGFEYNEKEHKKNKYNALWDIKPEEENTMRTKYLIRDCWTNTQLLELKKHIDEVIEEKEEVSYERI